MVVFCHLFVFFSVFCVSYIKGDATYIRGAVNHRRIANINKVWSTIEKGFVKIKYGYAADAFDQTFVALQKHVSEVSRKYVGMTSGSDASLVSKIARRKPPADTSLRTRSYFS